MQSNTRSGLFAAIVSVAVMLFLPPPLGAQEAERDEIEEIIVVGSQIQGAKVNEILPISVLGEEDIELTGALSGDELFRSLPEVGDIRFNASQVSGGVNDARGDTTSINLRSLGTGNTLMLLNGRRLVNHPGYQTEDFVPVVSPNTNALPVLGIERLEVLRDGASAIYGADAVAGVINTVLKKDFEGLTLALRGRTYEELSRDDFSAAVEYGWRSRDERTSLSLFAQYYSRDPVNASERELTANSDRRYIYEGAGTAWRNVSISSPWAIFVLPTNTQGFDDDGNPEGRYPDFVSGSRTFHVRTASGAMDETCLPQDASVCFDDGNIGDSDRYEFHALTQIFSELNRHRLLLFANHEINPDLEWFGELSYYNAQTRRVYYPSSGFSTVTLTVPKENHWNPFGAATLPDGTPNPNRLTLPASSEYQIPDEGEDVRLRYYRVVDAGPRIIEVENETWRFLSGLRGTLGEWDWESAVAYSHALSTDVTQNRVSNTLFQRALSLSTPDAYNPFNGAASASVPDCSYDGYRDCTPNSASVIDSFLVDVSRKGTSRLFTYDLRASRTDLLELPAGPVGVAVGVEYRDLSFKDDRDPRLDGTITFYDVVRGQHQGVSCVSAEGASAEPTYTVESATCPEGFERFVTVSDIMNSSPTRDSTGSRDVVSGYLEFSVPLLGEGQSVPLVESVDMQLAARFEDFSDVGNIFVPKVALSWRLHEFAMLRGAYSEGFRAPNLVQTNEAGVSRVNTRDPNYRCFVAELQDAEDLESAADPENFEGIAGDVCGGVRVVRTAVGSDDLVPEESENLNLGVVFDPEFAFLPDGALTLTVDWWKATKEGTVGIFGDEEHIQLDALWRLASDQSNCDAVRTNPAVVRAEADVGDTFFASQGYCPAGEVQQVNDLYVNLETRTIEGWDIGVYFQMDTAIGEFDYKFNLARISRFYQEPGALDRELVAARVAAEATGVDLSGSDLGDIGLSGEENLLQQNGRPKLQWTSSLRWRQGDWGAGLRARHIGEFTDTSADDADGNDWTVDSWTVLSADVYRTLEIRDTRTRVRLGVTNLTNEDAPLADEFNFGYFGALHNHLGRSIYLDLRVQF